MNDIQFLIAQARLQGFTVERRGSGHFLLRPPTRAGPLVVISSSPSDYRALAKIRSQLKRAGVVAPAKSSSKSRKGDKTMARIPTPTKTRRAAPTTEAPTQGEREQARDRQTLERGEAMAPDARLDRDLAHLADTSPARRVQSRRRAPEEVGLVYRGKRSRALLVDQYITVTVPDEDNEAAVADKQDVIPGLDEESQRQAWAAEDMRRGMTRPYVRLADRLVLSGPNYTFEKDKTVLVHEDDVAYLLAHDTYRIERAADIEVDDVLPRRRPGYRGS